MERAATDALGTAHATASAARFFSELVRNLSIRAWPAAPKLGEGGSFGFRHFIPMFAAAHCAVRRFRVKFSPGH
jgi:hypothetical protein